MNDRLDLHASGPLRQGIQRPPGRGPVRGRPAKGAQGLRREERLPWSAREYVDEAESGRIADRPQFQKMLDAAGKPEAPFKEILVWKFSRFTRKREHAVAFKSMLRRRGIRVVSITEQAEDTASGRLLEAIIEGVDEFYSENLAQEVTSGGCGRRRLRGFWIASRVPYGFSKVHGAGRGQEAPQAWNPIPATAPVVERIFGMAEAGRGILDITKHPQRRGHRQPHRQALVQERRPHHPETNEAYTGTLVWGTDAKDKADPVRVEKAFPAIVSKARVPPREPEAALPRSQEEPPPQQWGAPTCSVALVRCKACNRALSGQDAKSGKFAYYVCQSLLKRGSGTCDDPQAQRQAASRRSGRGQDSGERAHRVQHPDVGEAGGRGDGRRGQGAAAEAGNHRGGAGGREAQVGTALRLLAETTDLDIDDFKPIITRAPGAAGDPGGHGEEARAMLSQRREVLDDVETITAYALDMSMFLNESELTERRAFIESFVKEIVKHARSTPWCATRIPGCPDELAPYRGETSRRWP